MNSKEEELAEIKKKLAALQSEYDEFAYIVSHDLGAPFRQIEGFSEIILSKLGDSFDEKTKRHFGLIASGAQNGKAIIRGLLEYSRLNTASEPFIEVNCNEVLKDAKASLSELIQSSNAKITSSDLPVIVADKTQITQLFRHLLKNALIYQRENISPKVEISVNKTQKKWRFSISDNGTGIRETHEESIFKVLRRGVKENGPTGDGMGLALAKKILVRHDGSIWLEESSEKGAVFCFEI